MDQKQMYELYQKYYSSVYIYALSLCKRKESAEDLVSETFIKAFSIDDTEGMKLKYWLLTVCRNLWIDKLRKSKLRQQPLQPLISEEEDPLLQLLKEERRRRLYRSIRKLPGHSAEILILYYFTGASLTEIASILQISYTNAKTILFRARIKLKKLFEEDDYEF